MRKEGREGGEEGKKEGESNKNSALFYSSRILYSVLVLAIFRQGICSRLPSLPPSLPPFYSRSRHAILNVEMQKAGALSSQLQTTKSFSYMHTISPTTPLSMIIVDSGNRISHAVNTPYEKRFRTVGEMVRDLFEHKV